MNIAVFTDSYKPQINGLVTSIVSFSKEIKKSGFEVFIFAPVIEGYEDREKNVHRVKSIEFSAYKEYKIGIPFGIFFDEKIRKTKFGLVHVHSPFSMGLAGLAFAKQHSIPVVGSFHTLFTEYLHYFIGTKTVQKNKLLTKNIKKGLWRYLIWFYNNCNVVVAPSEKIKNVLKRRGLKSEVVVIPTGIEMKKPALNRSVLRKKFGFGMSDQILLHVGRITKEKNIDFIVETFAKIAEKNGNAKLVIASDGPYKNEIKELAARKKIGNKILFTGYVSRKKLEDIYSLADVFVMASKTETQGIVLNEAARSRLPVVVLDSPVLSELVNEHKIGIVSDCKNFEKNITKLLNSRALREHFEKNISKKMEEYDIKRCAGEMIRVYSGLIRNNQNMK